MEADSSPDSTIEVASSPELLYTVLCGIVVALVSSLLYWYNNSTPPSKPSTTPPPPPAPNDNGTPKTAEPKKPSSGPGSKAKKQPVAGKKSAAPTSHPLFVALLRGHTDTINDMHLDQSGKLLATVSNDQTARVWYIKDLEKGRDVKYTRIPLDSDGTSVSVSPDGKAVAVLLPNRGCVEIHRLGKKPGDATSLLLTIEQIKGDLKDVSISPTGKFIIVSTTTTLVYVYSLKGELLHTIDTAQMYNGQVSISPCKDLIGVSGFTPEVHFWAVQFSKAGSFQGVTEAMDLSGHKSGVYSFAFSGDSRKAVTASKDGTWRVHNTDVSWHLNEDPKQLISGSLPEEGPARAALSPDGRVVAIATGCGMTLFNADTAEKLDSLSGIHSDTITRLEFSDTGKYLYTCGKDKTVRVWLNRAGMMRDIELWSDSLRAATNASHKDRLKQQIAETTARLAELAALT